ncbi:putative chromosome-partitioning protein ParB [Anaerolineae bacterium]|nr:putative chromosome-partitioning protein ParB [Anaerolineae bacterium]
MKTFPQTDKPKLLYVSLDQLKVHPKNMRRFYPPAGVQKIADSMRAQIKRGQNPVIHALRIVPNGKADHYFVVDGNMRLAAARLIGAKCPPLKCELVKESDAEQALAMIVTAKFRFTPDPISEALHYQRLCREEHYTPRQIALETGIATTTIDNRLLLLKLEPEIQELIGQGSLSADPRIARAFMAIPSSEARVKLAKRLARDGISIKATITACEKLAEHLKEAETHDDSSGHDNSCEQSKLMSSPALEFAQIKSHLRPNENLAADWSDVRAAAQAMCQPCEIRQSSLENIAEPAWELISHAANTTCTRCNVSTVAGACRQCPGVDILNHLLQVAGVKQ